MSSDVLSRDEQVEFLSDQTIFAAISNRLGHQVFNCAEYLSVSRSQVLSHFRDNPAKAEALCLQNKADKALHDVLCLASRNGRYVIFDMDHGIERWHRWYSSAIEAATDYVAFQACYKYPDGFGHEPLVINFPQPTRG